MNFLNINFISLGEVAVIGKEGFCTKDCNVVKKLWENANSNFAEVLQLGKKDDEGNFVGFWGAMSDESMAFLPWSEGFTKGYYLAGIETDIDAIAPDGWKKWIMPARKYLIAEVELYLYMDIFNQVIKYELPSRNLKLIGAACDFTNPKTQKNYIYFPVDFKK